jgi:hypothetical protein
MDFEPYADSMKKRGYDQVAERVWKPLTTSAEHTPHSERYGARGVGVLRSDLRAVQGHTSGLGITENISMIAQQFKFTYRSSNPWWLRGQGGDLHL